MLLPAVQKVREAANEATAVGSLRQIDTAQDEFRRQNGRFALSVGELAAAGLLDVALGGGVKQGYSFNLMTANNFEWSAMATPEVPAKTGDRSFYADETGLIRAIGCPPGGMPVLGKDGKLHCVPGAIALAQPIGSSTGVAAIDGGNLMSDGAALPAAKMFLGRLVKQVIAEFDADGSGDLTVGELLSADILGIARRLAPTLSDTSGPPLGEDAVLQAHLQRFQRRLARELDLQASETSLPAV
jgi:hypothetical protein